MLKQVGFVSLPMHSAGGFDHADVHKASGRVYVAHTANDSVEVVDGDASRHSRTISGCIEASGVLCAQEEGLVFAAARGAGKLLVIDEDDRVVKHVKAGHKPNGLAWDSRRKHLFAADVEDNKGRMFNPLTGEALGEVALRGRPRWSVYVGTLDLLLVNIKDPPGVEFLAPDTLVERKFVPISAQGPHGLEVDEVESRAFVACDGRALVTLSLDSEKELGKVPLSGEPDVLWFNPERKRLYCAVGSPGVIDVVDTKEFSPIETVATEEGAHTLTFDPKRQRLYAMMPRSCGLSVFSEK